MPRRTVEPNEERPVGDVKMVRWLVPFVWPRDDPGLKLRLAGAIFVLVLMAGLNALVPILFARAVDAFTVTEQAVLAAPIALLALYGFLHWGGKLASEARWLFYGPIEQRIQRRVGLAVSEVGQDRTVGAEPPDRQVGPVDRDGTGNDADPTAVGEPAVDPRPQRIDAPTDRRDDPFDDHVELRPLHREVGALDLSPSFDPHRPGTVDHHLGDRRVLEDAIQRTESGEQ